MTKPKPYHGHESEYRRMKREGIPSWNERTGDAPVDCYTERFLKEVFDEPWTPRPPGRALELGCGTAPLLRSLHDRGWRGTGVDVSPTAIALARKQSRGRRLKLVVGDVLKLDFIPDDSIDLAVDGHCFHCLTDPADHPPFFRETSRVLKPGGVFVFNSSCSPVLPREFREKFGCVYKKRICVRTEAAKRYREALRIRGVLHMPIRYYEHWRTVLRLIDRAGLTTRLFRVALCRRDEPFSHLCAAAVKE